MKFWEALKLLDEGDVILIRNKKNKENEHLSLGVGRTIGGKGNMAKSLFDEDGQGANIIKPSLYFCDDWEAINKDGIVLKASL